MRASRLMSILLMLQSRGRLSAHYLADELEVSVRTIYRDIDELSAAGVPVYAEKGPSGGFELMEGYQTRLTGLDLPEAQTLFLSGLPGAAAQLGLGEAMAKARLKLLAALPDHSRRGAAQIAERFHLDPVSWFQRPEEQSILPELALAVWQRRYVQYRYDSWKGMVERQALPLGLVLKAGLWYVMAKVDDQLRTYRVSSILSLTVGAVAPETAETFDLPAHWTAFCRNYESRMQQGQALIRARPEALRQLARNSGAMGDAVTKAGPPDDDGWHTLDIPTESTDRTVEELLPLADKVEILSPTGMRDAMKDAVTRLARLYQTG